MSSDWPMHSLSDFINVKHGFAFKGEFFKDEHTSDLLVTPGNFAIGGGFKSDKFKFYEGPISEDYVLSEGDLIVTMTDLSKQADTLGYSALVPKIADCRLLHNQRVGLVEFKNDELDKTYLYFLLRSREYRHHVVSTATGSTVKHSSPTKILSFSFRKPPKDIQIDIGKKLIALEEKAENNTRTNQALEQIAQALFKSWFVDFDPVKAKIETLAAGGSAADAELAAMSVISVKTIGELNSLKASNLEKFNKLAQTAALFPAAIQDSGLGEIPEGWEVSEIGSEVTVVGGGTPATKNTEFWEEGTINWTTPRDMSGLSSKVLTSTDRKITELGLKKISSGLLPVNTVLMSSRAPVGYLALAKIPVAINQGYIAMKCEARLSPEYVLLWCEQNMDEIKQRASGTTFAEISKANFKPIPVIVPTISVVDAFSVQVSEVYNFVHSNILQSESLSSARDLLLPKLLSGEFSKGGE